MSTRARTHPRHVCAVSHGSTEHYDLSRRALASTAIASHLDMLIEREREPARNPSSGICFAPAMPDFGAVPQVLRGRMPAREICVRKLHRLYNVNDYCVMTSHSVDRIRRRRAGCFRAISRSTNELLPAPPAAEVQSRCELCSLVVVGDLPLRSWMGKMSTEWVRFFRGEASD